MSSYTTKQGDMWDSIAYSLYGNVNYADVLIEANPQYRFVYRFSAGTVLTVPEVEERITADTLPLWKRAD